MSNRCGLGHIQCRWCWVHSPEDKVDYRLHSGGNVVTNIVQVYIVASCMYLPQVKLELAVAEKFAGQDEVQEPSVALKKGQHPLVS